MLFTNRKGNVSKDALYRLKQYYQQITSECLLDIEIAFMQNHTYYIACIAYWDDNGRSMSNPTKELLSGTTKKQDTPHTIQSTKSSLSHLQQYYLLL
jgi:hypothetical protein